MHARLGVRLSRSEAGVRYAMQQERRRDELLATQKSQLRQGRRCSVSARTGQFTYKRNSAWRVAFPPCRGRVGARRVTNGLFAGVGASEAVPARTRWHRLTDYFFLRLLPLALQPTVRIISVPWTESPEYVSPTSSRLVSPHAIPTAGVLKRSTRSAARSRLTSRIR